MPGSAKSSSTSQSSSGTPAPCSCPTPTPSCIILTLSAGTSNDINGVDHFSWDAQTITLTSFGNCLWFSAAGAFSYVNNGTVHLTGQIGIFLDNTLECVEECTWVVEMPYGGFFISYSGATVDAGSYIQVAGGGYECTSYNQTANGTGTVSVSICP